MAGGWGRKGWDRKGWDEPREEPKVPPRPRGRHSQPISTECRLGVRPLTEPSSLDGVGRCNDEVFSRPVYVPTFRVSRDGRRPYRNYAVGSKSRRGTVPDSGDTVIIGLSWRGRRVRTEKGKERSKRQGLSGGNFWRTSI